MGQPQRIRIELTTEQKQQIKDAFGREPAALDLDIKELEERIAPSKGPIEILSYGFGATNAGS